MGANNFMALELQRKVEMSNRTCIGACLTQTGAYWWFDLVGNITPLSYKGRSMYFWINLHRGFNLRLNGFAAFLHVKTKFSTEVEPRLNRG